MAMLVLVGMFGGILSLHSQEKAERVPQDLDPLPDAMVEQLRKAAGIPEPGGVRRDWESAPGAITTFREGITLPWYSDTMLEFEGRTYLTRRDAETAMMVIQLVGELMGYEYVLDWGIDHDFVQFVEFDRSVRVRKVEEDTTYKSFSDPVPVTDVEREIWSEVWERTYSRQARIRGWEDHWRFRLQFVYREYHHKEKSE